MNLKPRSDEYPQECVYMIYAFAAAWREKMVCTEKLVSAWGENLWKWFSYISVVLLMEYWFVLGHWFGLFGGRNGGRPVMEVVSKNNIVWIIGWCHHVPQRRADPSCNHGHGVLATSILITLGVLQLKILEGRGFRDVDMAYDGKNQLDGIQDKWRNTSNDGWKKITYSNNPKVTGKLARRSIVSYL